MIFTFTAYAEMSQTNGTSVTVLTREKIEHSVAGGAGTLPSLYFKWLVILLAVFMLIDVV